MGIFWWMMFVPCFAGAPQSWIPHIPPADGAYVMRLTLSNLSDSPSTVTFQPLSRLGEPGALIDLDLAGRETRVVAAADLFSGDTSHATVVLQGCLLTWSYDVRGQALGPMLFSIAPDLDYGVEFDWQPDAHGAFGIAVVNASEREANLVMKVSSLAGNVMSQRHLAMLPFEKQLLDLSELCCETDVRVSLHSSEPLAWVAAQLSWQTISSSFFPRRVRHIRRYSNVEPVVFADPRLQELMLDMADQDPPDGELSLAELADLTDITIEDESVESLEGLQACIGLRNLTCSGSFESIEPLTALIQLESLRLIDCSRLTQLPAKWNSNALDWLEIANAPLKAFDLRGLKKLILLSVTGLELDVEAVQLPVSVHFLSLSECQIDQWPTELLSHLTQLRTLGLRRNPIDVLPQITYLKSLRSLSLYYCELTSVEALLDLPPMSFVDVSYNYLKSDQCPNIETLSQRGLVSYRYQREGRLDCDTRISEGDWLQ